ncbi:MAG: hypothetical protein V4490_06980 [Pseudomonadota bacterium]
MNTPTLSRLPQARFALHIDSDRCAIPFEQDPQLFQHAGDSFGGEKASDGPANDDGLLIELSVRDLEERPRTFIIRGARNTLTQGSIQYQMAQEKRSSEPYTLRPYSLDATDEAGYPVGFDSFVRHISYGIGTDMLMAYGVNISSAAGRTGYIISKPILGVALPEFHKTGMGEYCCDTEKPTQIRLIDTYFGYFFFSQLLLSATDGYWSRLNLNIIPVCHKRLLFVQDDGTLTYTSTSPITDQVRELTQRSRTISPWHGLNASVSLEDVKQYCATLLSRQLISDLQHQNLIHGFTYFFQDGIPPVNDDYIAAVKEHTHTITSILTPLLNQLRSQWGPEYEHLIDSRFSLENAVAESPKHVVPDSPTRPRM